MDTDLRLWWTIGVAIFVMGIAWGKHQITLRSHEKQFEICRVGELMTKDMCKEYHESRQAKTEVVLFQIQKSIDEMKEKQGLESEKAQRFQLQMAAMIGREGLKNVQ